MLKLILHGSAWLIGFTDDLGLLVAADTPEELTRHVTVNFRLIKSWLTEYCLEFAERKTNAVFLRGNKCR